MIAPFTLIMHYFVSWPVCLIRKKLFLDLSSKVLLQPLVVLRVAFTDTW